MARTHPPYYRSKKWQRVRAATHRRDGYRCLCCGAESSEKADGYDGSVPLAGLCMAHIVHLSDGGKNEPSNFQTLCNSCNSRQGNSTQDWRG